MVNSFKHTLLDHRLLRATVDGTPSTAVKGMRDTETYYAHRGDHVWICHVTCPGQAFHYKFIAQSGLFPHSGTSLMCP